MRSAARAFLHDAEVSIREGLLECAVDRRAAQLGGEGPQLAVQLHDRRGQSLAIGEGEAATQLYVALKTTDPPIVVQTGCAEACS